MKYNTLSFRQVEAGLNNPGIMESIIDFLFGKTKNTAVRVSSDEKILFNVWKTIKLGTLKNADEFRQAFKENGFKVGIWGNDILDKSSFTVSQTEEEIQLVNVSVADLGFKNGAKYGNICAKAKEIGLEFCPNEVGPQLRLQYKDQPKGELLRIVMEPIIDSDGGFNIFGVTHNNHDLWLICPHGYSDRFWSAHHRFVFCFRK